MITLQEITEPEKLDEYHRFRHRIYRGSDQREFLKDNTGYDRDEYDNDAVHLGWYKQGKLVGCVRFIRPVAGTDPLYYFTHMPSYAAAPARALMQEYLDQGLPFVEVSRICIDPEHRDLKTVKEFVLATMAKSYQLGLDQALFTCFKPHVPFWLRMGFTVLKEAREFRCRLNEEPSMCMVYRYANLPASILNELPAYTASLTTTLALAA